MDRSTGISTRWLEPAVGDFYGRLVADDLLAPFFDGVDIGALAKKSGAVPRHHPQWRC